MTQETQLHGNRKTLAKTKLLYGNGCNKHPDCFTCPFPKCTFTTYTSTFYKYIAKKQITNSESA